MWPFRARAPDPDEIRTIRRRVDQLEDDVVGLKEKHENLRGRYLTQARRITDLIRDLEPADDDEEEEEDPFLSELDRRRNEHG